MKKICHMTSAHSPEDVRIFYKECASLAKAGYEVYLVERGESYDKDGVHIVGVGTIPDGRIQRMTKGAKMVYLKAKGLDCDVYHIHDPELLPYGMKLKKSGKKVVFDSHENTLEQMMDKKWIPTIIRPFVSFVYRNYATSIFKNLDCLVSVTPHIVEQLKLINPNTWMVTNYPILSNSSVRVKKKDEFCLCFTGGIDNQWSHKEIIDVLAKTNNVCYELCGSASEQYLEVLKNSDGWDKVNYYGKVPFERALEIQQRSNIGMAILKPSRNSGWMMGTIGNTKLFEYMMAGLPVICTDFKLWRDIINRWHCGICVPAGNPDALKDAICYLMNHPSEAREMGENGRIAVEKEFNWSTQEEQLLELYDSL